jgi:hypothetical protein
MITRGHFIGEIVDGLGDIARQAEVRAKLGLTDLHIFVEDFFKTCLNHLLKLQLTNLNSDRHNVPGLDLGDAGAGRAFQITAQRSSAKINETLRKITDDQLKTYAEVQVLVVGRKQSSYTLDPTLSARVSFEEADIWDVDELCKLAMNLDLPDLQALYEHIRRETVKVKIELEVPDEDGKYPTTLFDRVEAVPKARGSDFSRLAAVPELVEYGATPEELKVAFDELAVALGKLPRVTREFLAVLVEKRDEPSGVIGSGDNFRISADRLPRILRYDDIDGELRILEDHGLVTEYEPGWEGKSAFWRVRFPWRKQEFLHLIVNDYLDAAGVPWRRVLVDLDFSIFGEPSTIPA